MTSLWSVCFFVNGTIFGSFFNVVGLRLPQKEDFIKSRSVCPACLHKLSWQELIPIFSYLLQKGRCKTCHTPISFLYPLMELLTGALFLYAYINIGWHPELITALLLISLTVIISVTDVHYMMIPNEVLLFYFPLFLFGAVLHPEISWFEPLSGATLGFVLIGLIILLSKGGMGQGDMKLLALLGFVLGIKNVLLTFFVAVCLGAVAGIYLLIKKKASRKTRVPFAPFLLIGALTSYFYGADIWNWYTTWLLG